MELYEVDQSELDLDIEGGIGSKKGISFAGGSALAPRSSGLHLSAVIRALESDLYPGLVNETNNPRWAELGFAWEAVLERALWDVRHYGGQSDDYFRPGEYVRDGIAMSPDAIYVPEWRLDEIKCTWKSAAHDIQDKRFWRWWTQIKSYCRAIGTDSARLWVFYVNGHYHAAGGEFGPTVKAWDAVFSPRELDEAWAMIVNFARSKGWL